MCGFICIFKGMRGFIGILIKVGGLNLHIYRKVSFFYILVALFNLHVS